MKCNKDGLLKVGWWAVPVSRTRRGAVLPRRHSPNSNAFVFRQIETSTIFLYVSPRLGKICTSNLQLCFSEMEQFFLAVIRRRHAVMQTMFYSSSTVPSTLELSSSGIPTPSTETPETWHIFTCKISGHTCRLCVIKTNQQHFPTQMLCVQGKRV